MIVFENIRTYVNGVLTGTSEREVYCISTADGYANAIINHIKLMEDNTDCVFVSRDGRNIYFEDVETKDVVKVLVTLYTPIRVLEIRYLHSEHEPIVWGRVSEAFKKQAAEDAKQVYQSGITHAKPLTAEQLREDITSYDTSSISVGVIE